MSEPCPSNSPAGRACQGQRGHDGQHWCCYPGGDDRWHSDPGATHDALLARIAELQAIVDKLVDADRRLGHFADMTSHTDEGSPFHMLIDACKVIREAAEAAQDSTPTP